MPVLSSFRDAVVCHACPCNIDQAIATSIAIAHVSLAGIPYGSLLFDVAVGVGPTLN